MTKRTKALQIPKSVKRAVEERDGGRCIICGALGDPVAHYIARSQGGLGIAENIFTACHGCHELYDQTAHRAVLRHEITEYLRIKYQNWDDVRLTYQK